jgi:hypothetical protein
MSLLDPLVSKLGAKSAKAFPGSGLLGAAGNGVTRNVCVGGEECHPGQAGWPAHRTSSSRRILEQPTSPGRVVLSQAANGIVRPLVLVFMLLLVNREKLMGDQVNGRAFNAVAWVTTGARSP